MKAGWEVKPLGEVCGKITDGSHNPPIGVESSDYFMLSSKNIWDDRIIFDKPRFLSEKHFWDENRRTDVTAGDVLLTIVGTIGRCAVVSESDRKFTLQRSVAVLKPLADYIDSRFLMYALQSMLERLVDGSQGAAQKGIYLMALRVLPIPIPPLEEQKRIVAVLDAAFEGLTRAKENAEANLENARELFGAFLEELFLKNGKNWSAAALQDTVTEECTLSYGIVQPGDDVEGGLPVVRPTDLGTPLISRSGLKTIAPEKADGYARTRLVGDEILLCVRGTTGVVAKALPELEGGNVTRGIVPIRFDGRKMLQDFGYYQFRSRHIQDQIEAQTYGAALRQINIRDLRKLSFVFPDITEQEELLPMLQDAQKNCEELVELNQAKLTDIADLRQSLLQKAFAGELT